MRETFNTTPLPEIVVPTAEEAVAMYERMGDRLTRDFGFGQDPLRPREDLKDSREHIYRCRNLTDRVIYSHFIDHTSASEMQFCLISRLPCSSVRHFKMFSKFHGSFGSEKVMEFLQSHKRDTFNVKEF